MAYDPDEDPLNDIIGGVAIVGIVGGMLLQAYFGAPDDGSLGLFDLVGLLVVAVAVFVGGAAIGIRWWANRPPSYPPYEPEERGD